MAACGSLVDRFTQGWVRATGRKVSADAQPWLDGPAGDPQSIGRHFFRAWADKHGCEIITGPPCGLLPRFDALGGGTFEPASIHPGVVSFYERTSEFDLDAWAHWRGAFRPLGRVLAVVFSRRLQQLNLPLSGLDTSQGMTSEVASVRGPGANGHRFTAWVRQLRASERVLYAGAYSICVLPEERSPCVRVVFPLPNGNAIVVMRPERDVNGSLRLESAGQGFGHPGFYFTLHDRNGLAWARYVKSMRETIVVVAREGEVRAEHELRIWGLTFLRLHYRLRPRPAGTAVPA